MAPDHEFTVELWVRAKVGRNGPLALLGDLVGRNKHPEVEKSVGWFLGVGRTTDDSLSMSCAFSNIQISGPLGVDAGDWYHVTATHETDGVTLYVNGKRWYRKFPMEDIRWRPSPIGLHLGSTAYDNYSNLREHQVDMRGLRISSTCLYHDEFDPPLTLQKQADTLLLLDFSHPSGKTIADLSGNQRNGTLHGAKWICLGEIE